MKKAFSLTALAAAAALAFSAQAQQPAAKSLKMQSTWPASLTLQDNFRYFAERMDKLTGGGIKIEAAAAVGAGDRDALVLETLMAFKRAGCSGVLTYHALHAARLLGG